MLINVLIYLFLHVLASFPLISASFDQILCQNVRQKIRVWAFFAFLISESGIFDIFIKNKVPWFRSKRGHTDRAENPSTPPFLQDLALQGVPPPFYQKILTPPFHTLGEKTQPPPL